VFENRVLRRIFGSKREEVAGGWRRLHNEELHDLYFSTDVNGVIKSKGIKLVGHVARMGHERFVKKSFVRKPAGKRPLRQTYA
jgi:hypothetical protein